MRKWTYVNCWHLSEYESDFMWKQYAGIGNAIAIQSTYQRLIDSIETEQDCYIGMIKYIGQDYYIKDGNIFSRFLHKRREFEHEKDVRLLIQDASPVSEEKKEGDTYASLNIGKENSINGIYINVNVTKLISNLYIYRRLQTNGF